MMSKKKQAIQGADNTAAAASFLPGSRPQAVRPRLSSYEDENMHDMCGGPDRIGRMIAVGAALHQMCLYA